MRISDWSSDVCSSDLFTAAIARPARAIRFEPGFSAGSLVRLPRLPASPHPPDLIPDILQRCGDGGIERIEATGLVQQRRDACAVGVAQLLVELHGALEHPLRIGLDCAFVAVAFEGETMAEIGRASCRERVCKYV